MLTLQKFVAFVASVLFLSPDAARLRTSVMLWAGAAAIVGGGALFSFCGSSSAVARPFERDIGGQTKKRV